MQTITSNITIIFIFCFSLSLYLLSLLFVFRVCFSLNDGVHGCQHSRNLWYILLLFVLCFVQDDGLARPESMRVYNIYLDIRQRTIHASVCQFAFFPSAVEAIWTCALCLHLCTISGKFSDMQKGFLILFVRLFCLCSFMVFVLFGCLCMFCLREYICMFDGQHVCMTAWSVVRVQAGCSDRSLLIFRVNYEDLKSRPKLRLCLVKC